MPKSQRQLSEDRRNKQVIWGASIVLIECVVLGGVALYVRHAGQPVANVERPAKLKQANAKQPNANPPAHDDEPEELPPRKEVVASDSPVRRPPASPPKRVAGVAAEPTKRRVDAARPSPSSPASSASPAEKSGKLVVEGTALATSTSKPPVVVLPDDAEPVEVEKERIRPGDEVIRLPARDVVVRKLDAERDRLIEEKNAELEQLREEIIYLANEGRVKNKELTERKTRASILQRQISDLKSRKVLATPDFFSSDSIRVGTFGSVDMDSNGMWLEVMAIDNEQQFVARLRYINEAPSEQFLSPTIYRGLSTKGMEIGKKVRLSATLLVAGVAERDGRRMGVYLIWDLPAFLKEPEKPEPVIRATGESGRKEKSGGD